MFLQEKRELFLIWPVFYSKNKYLSNFIIAKFHFFRPMDINQPIAALPLDFSQLTGDYKTAFELLLNLIEQLTAEKRGLQAEIQRLRDENNRLKGEQGKPVIKAKVRPTNDISSEKERHRRVNQANLPRKRAKNKTLIITRLEKCPLDKRHLPPDVVFKGYQTVIVQDIKIETDNVAFQKEIYYSPSTQKSYIAPLPAAYQGAFGPNLRNLIITLKNIANMSEAKIGELLANFGVSISSGMISNILIKNHQPFHQEKTAIVAAGLPTTVCQQFDDTGARVNGQNYYTHIFGNRYFRAYSTQPHKNRLTVLQVLLNGQPLQYRLNALAFQLLSQLQLSPKHLDGLQPLASDQCFTEAEFENLLAHHLPTLTPMVKAKIREAAALAAYRGGGNHWVVPILLADDAPQFKLLSAHLAACWVHDGRHYKKLSPVFKYHAQKLQHFRGRYWHYYQQLCVYQQAPTPEAEQRLAREFDDLFSTVTGYQDLDARIAKSKQKKESLLLVLKYPEIPLHNNEMELGARTCVRKRDVSLHTMTAEGTQANDTFLTIIDTCKKLGVNPFLYILDRIKKTNALPSLAQLIQQKQKQLSSA